MPKGQWSFLHEWVIYDYILARSEECTLRFKKVIASGKLLGKPKWIKVKNTPARHSVAAAAGCMSPTGIFILMKK